jgi:hypothetical protein
MKSIKEWMEENGLGTKSQHRALFGGSMVKIDTEIRTLLKNKIEQIIKDAEKEDPNFSKTKILRDIMAVVEAMLSDNKGTTLSADKSYDKLTQDME